MIQIYGVALDRLQGCEEKLLAALPARIRDPWQTRHPHIKSRSAYLASLAGAWLLWKSGVDGTLAYQSLGKPYLHTPDRAISITHTSAYAFLAISDSSDAIGLDAEDQGRFPAARLPELVSRWFTEAERTEWERTPTEETFLSIWTRKEALVKLTGEGLRAIRKTDGLQMQTQTYRLDSTLVTLAYSGAQAPPLAIELI